MGSQNRTVEQKVARIAARQHGVVTRVQLLRDGVTDREIQRRRESGALIDVFPGVYRVGHGAPNLHAHYLAAVLACGAGAVPSGRAAAHLLGLSKGPLPGPKSRRRPSGASPA